MRIISAAAWRVSVVWLLLALLLAVTPVNAAEGHRRAVFPIESFGSRGINVTALQHLLRSSGRQLPVNGIFDLTTLQAVRAFQEQAGLKRNGVVSESTWERLLPQLGPGSRGEAVIAVQKLLNDKRRNGLALSAVYDSATSQAVRDFQRHVGLSPSGELGLKTWRNLLWQFTRPRFAGTSLCDYHSGSGKAANWATSSTVAHLEAAATLFHQRTGLKTSYGDASLEHGGNIPNHATHELGLDVDLGLIRRDGRHCQRLGLDYRHGQYDRDKTRELIKAVYDTAPGRVKLIYFNDPVLVREGLVQRYPNHSHHLHVRYCEAGHADPRYRCPRAPTMPSAELQQKLAAASALKPDPSVVRRALAARLEDHRF